MTDTTSNPTLAHAAFVAAPIPAWLRNAPPDGRARLHLLAKEAEAARHAFKQASNAFMPLQAYALERLRGELSAMDLATVDPQAAVLYWVDPDGKRPPSQSSLLEAALLNFHVRDTSPARYGPGSGVYAGTRPDGKPDVARPLPITPWAFANRCRALDIGGGYQHALSTWIPDAVPSRTDRLEDVPALSWLAFQSLRKGFISEACSASLSGHLGKEGEQLLSWWGLAPGSGTLPAQASRLELFDFPLTGVLVFAAQTPTEDTQSVVAYIPGDPAGAVTQYADVKTFVSTLGERLRQPAFQKFFNQFAPLARRLEFMKKIQEVTAPVGWRSSHFTWTPVPLMGDPFVEGYRIWAQQTLANAGELAVPTAWVDRRDTVERYAHWVDMGEQLGLTLALMVGSTVPGVNVIVDAIVLGQGLYNVYEGVKAWKAGDSQAALDHLFGAVENVGFFGLGHRPRPTPAAVSFAERLVPVTDANGEVRLWQPDLDDFRASGVPPSDVSPGVDGVYRHQGRAWVRLQGEFHEVEGHGRTRRLRRPLGDTTGYAPLLLGNGRGGWRAAHDSPVTWSAADLIRRFDHRYEALPEEQLIEAQRLCGISDAQLRQAHLDGAAAPSPLAHLLARRRVERQLAANLQALRTTRRLEGAAPEVIATLAQVPGWPAGRTLAIVSDATPTNPRPATQSEPQGNPVQLDNAALREGTWPQRVIQQLGADAYSALVGMDMSLIPPEPAYQALADHWAHYLEGQREQLVRRIMASEARTDTLALTLQRHFPGLTNEAIDSLSCDLPQAHREALRAGRIPPAVAGAAVEALRQQRVATACDALAQGRPGPDRDRLVFGLWAELGPWAASMRLQLRESHLNGVVLEHTGPATGPRWSVVRSGTRYQAFDEQGQQLSELTSLESALYATVPDHIRPSFMQRVGDSAGLRTQLLGLALSDRSALRVLLGMAADNQRFFRAPTRQPNGAVGYTLSGRPRWLNTLPGPHPMMVALRGLFPEVSEAELQYIRTGLGEGESATRALARLHQDFSRLQSELDTWVHRASEVPTEERPDEQANREAIRNELIAAWQRRSVNYRPGGPGYSVSLHNWTVAELPSLTVDFNHVGRLSMVDMDLTDVDEAFLQRFPNVRWLDLSANPLARVPSGVSRFARLELLNLDDTGERTFLEVFNAVQPAANTLRHLELVRTSLTLGVEDFERLRQLPELRTLELDDNEIQLTPETVNGFNQLTQLQELSLSGNPLRLAPNVAGLTQLALLDLSNALLEGFPPGLTDLMDLDPPRLIDVSLLRNVIIDLPDFSGTRFIQRIRESRADEESPYHGSRLTLDGNPLSEQSRAILERSDLHYFSDLGSEDSDEGPDQDEWLIDCPEALSALIRNERSSVEAANFYRLLSRVVDTADYRTDPAAVRARAHALVATWLQPGEQAGPGLETLRQRLFELAQDTHNTCGDGVSLTLDEMELEVQAWRIVATSATPGDGPLRESLTFHRGLWRRALIDDFARRIVRARVARRAAIAEARADLPALDPLDDIEDARLDDGLDEVEVRLKLFRALEGVLELPEVRGMRYDAYLRGETIQRVGVAVLDADTDAAFSRWVAERPSFRIYLENAHAQAFEQIRERWQEASNYLFSLGTDEVPPPWPPELDGLRQALPEVAWERSPQPTLTDQQLRLAYDWTSRQRGQALDEQALRLTQTLLGMNQGTPL
ncbi:MULTISPECIES: dermonecrotic toxin domain-containing protein [Pseudomonas]|uniref:RING-type E3 ubiquitin transferase n=1 Tax=Pseudomonas quercus TaxID=2722792 RepID=A0ABX0YF63_9PSED|nr:MULTISPECIES: DUF6543 domain-containing protein [Pseudomonas]MBF7143865.1 hypothetical protein [Pseudomonas sp. LY10J]NJP02056.1 hypothetical protein [Pseudomonas quercus]